MEPLVPQNAAAAGCVACNRTGRVHLAGAVPPWAPRCADDPTSAPCPYCRPDAWRAAFDEWNTGPGAQVWDDRYDWGRG